MRRNDDGGIAEDRRQRPKTAHEVAGRDVVVHVRAVEVRGERVDDDEGEIRQTRASFSSAAKTASGVALTVNDEEAIAKRRVRNAVKALGDREPRNGVVGIFDREVDDAALLDVESRMSARPVATASAAMVDNAVLPALVGPVSV